MIRCHFASGCIISRVFKKSHFVVISMHDVFNSICFQIENLLISSRGQIKLCDFGSSTITQHVPDESWTALQRSLVEDEVNLLEMLHFWTHCSKMKQCSKCWDINLVKD